MVALGWVIRAFSVPVLAQVVARDLYLALARNNYAMQLKILRQVMSFHACRDARCAKTLASGWMHTSTSCHAVKPKQ